MELSIYDIHTQDEQGQSKLTDVDKGCRGPGLIQTSSMTYSDLQVLMS
jgi:hypothetical protein